MIAASLAGHLVHELPDAEGRPADRPWRLDPVPLILDGGTFAALAAAIAERLLGMEALLADLYGPRRAVKEGWVPAEVLASSSRYRLAAVGDPAARALADELRRRRVAPGGRIMARRARSRRQPDRGRLRHDRPRGDGPGGGRAARPAGARRSGVDQRVPVRAAPRPCRGEPRQQPTHRGVLRWDQRSGLRRALVARSLARLPPRRGARPRRATRPAVAADARRSRPDRRRLSAPRRRGDRPDRGEREQHHRCAGAPAGGDGGWGHPCQRPWRWDPRGPNAGAALGTGHCRPHRHEAAASPAGA